MANRPKHLKYSSLAEASSVVAYAQDALIKLDGEMADINRMISTHREVMAIPCHAPTPLLSQRGAIIAQQALTKAQLNAACDAVDYFALAEAFGTGK